MELKTRGRILLVVSAMAITATVVASIPSCARRSETAARKPVRLTIAATTLTASAAVYVAEGKGFLKEEGLDAEVRTYAAGRYALADTLAGKADVAMVADTPIARAALDGSTPAVVATVDSIEDANHIVTRKDRGVMKASDLVGKRVGVVTGTSADYFLHVYLVTSNVDPKAVTIVPLGATEQVSALQSGTVDAISAFSPYDFQAQEALGDNALVLSNPALYTTTWNLVIDGRRREELKEPLKRLLEAIGRANSYMESNSAQSQEMTARKTNVPVALIRAQWSSNKWRLDLDQTLILTLEDEARWMLGGRDLVPDFLNYIDSGPLREVEPDGVTIVEPKD